MKTYSCMSCGRSKIALYYTKCPVCRADNKNFIMISTETKQKEKNISNRKFYNDPDKRLFSIRLQNYRVY